MKFRKLLVFAFIAGCADSLALATSSSPDAGGGGDGGGDGGTVADGNTVTLPDGRVVGRDGGTTCPSSHGPAMVKIDDEYCIDSTEVTNGQFADFVAAHEPVPDPLPPGFTEGSCFALATAGSDPNAPIANVNFCTAYAFCAWAGKRLCGGRGGAQVDLVDGFRDASADEWFNACSNGGHDDFPYGKYEAGTCNATPMGASDFASVADARSFSRCQSDAGVFDLIGNVQEWESACQRDGGDCFLRGGSVRDTDNTLLTCRVAQPVAPSSAAVAAGIRCCADLIPAP